MDQKPIQEKVKSGFLKAGIQTANKHLFVCIGPDCCSGEAGATLWEVIKTRVRDTGVKVMRTKAGCFRVCAGGPWLVIYPDGVWYSEVTPERFERILQQHLIGGHPVEEWVTVRNSFCDGASDAAIVKP